ncbi:YigZ family protein [Arcobacteraceae bacterium]|nr:YigZ family protein [Arcobacteraceae bacterium]
MQCITSQSSITLEIKKSKFITYISPYSEFNEMMKSLKKEHTKARHFVYAYRYLNEFNQVVENSSDDGEPKGTSGRPALSVLSGAELINTSVIIVRYFGGIRLGTGGLVKAYSDAVNLVLKSSVIQEYVKLEKKKLYITYPQLSQIEYLLTQYEIKIIDKIFTDKICLNLEASSQDYDKISRELFRDNILEDL